MRLFCQAITDPLQCVGPHAGGPVFQASRRPLLMVAVAFRHVLRRRTVPRMEAPWVRGYHLVSCPDLKQVIEGMQFHFMTNVLVRDRVVVLLVLNVVIDIHLRFFNMPVAPWMHRQLTQRGSVQSFEGLPAVTRQLFEGTFVEVCDQRTDAVVQLRQREEDLVA